MPKYQIYRIHGRIQGGVMAVEVLLDQRVKVWMIVDTGSAFTVVTQAVALRLGLDVLNPIRRQPIALAQGPNIVAPMVVIPGIEVDGCRLTNVEALVMAVPTTLRVSGFLGVNFMSGLSPIFDFQRGQLILRRSIRG
jgi:clan AA aspartic protease (TIGR02281 family)